VADVKTQFEKACNGMSQKSDCAADKEEVCRMNHNIKDTLDKVVIFVENLSARVKELDDLC
jgi:hypothetical protein